MKKILYFVVICLAFATNAMALSVNSNLEKWGSSSFLSKKQFLVKKGKDVTKCVTLIDNYILKSKRAGLYWTGERFLHTSVVTEKCPNSQKKTGDLKNIVKYIIKKLDKTCRIKAIWVEPLLGNDTKEVILCFKNKKPKIYNYYSDTKKIGFVQQPILKKNKYHIGNGEHYRIKAKTVVVYGTNNWKEVYRRIK